MSGQLSIAEALAQATSGLTASLNALASAEAGVGQAELAIADAEVQQAVAERAAEDAHAGRDAAIVAVDDAKAHTLGSVNGVRGVLDRLVSERLGLDEPIGVTLANGSSDPVTIEVNGESVTIDPGTSESI